MKKIKKVDSKSAQSVFAFMCPCMGSCSSCGCICMREAVTASSYNGSYNAVGVVGMGGTEGPTW